jgi:hypothetical protein
VKLSLPEDIVSPLDLQGLIEELRQYTKWFRHAAIQSKQQSHSVADQPVLSAAADQLITNLTSRKSIDEASLEELLAGLVSYADSAPQVTITLAAPPSPSLKKQLAATCRRTIAPGVLVNCQFNGNLLGGMVVRYGSHIHDWSFRRQILANRQKFPKVLRDV